MPIADHLPGTRVLESYRKWDGAERWQVEGILLGTDDWGTWVGFPADTRMRRPGHDFRVKRSRVVLFPDGDGWAASFWSSGNRAEAADIYIDLATTPIWSDHGGLEVTMVDMDLDVVRQVDGTTFIDDVDEFADHQKLVGYPPDVVQRVRADADALLAAVRAGSPPFDGATRVTWEQRLVELAP